MVMNNNPFGGFMPMLRNNSDALLQAGVGLLSGRTPQEQFAMGAQGFTQGRKENKTKQWIAQNAPPEIAQAVEAGVIAPADAFRALTEAKTKRAPLEINGKLVDPETYQVLADFSTPAAPPKPDEFTVRRQQAQELGMSPDDPRYQSFALTGKFPREDAQPLTATDKKAMWAAEDEIPLLDNTIASLEQAKALNRQTYTGTGAGLLGTIGTNVPGAGLVLDRDKAVATSEFNKLMSMEAIQAMAQSLKGATTDSELARFVDILADPSTDPDIRERTIDRMMQLAERQRQVKLNRINELRGAASPGGASPRSNRTSSGVTWSVEP